MESGVVLFYSTNAALRLEKALKKQKLFCKLVPTPRELSSDCGTALRFSWEQVEKVRESIDALGIEISTVCRV